jgi:hypothetical protein
MMWGAVGCCSGVAFSSRKAGQLPSHRSHFLHEEGSVGMHGKGSDCAQVQKVLRKNSERGALECRRVRIREQRNGA